MHKYKEVGLSAPQIGVKKRVVLINRDSDRSSKNEHVFVNAKLLQTSETQSMFLERCLSFPGIHAKVPRFDWVEIEAKNAQGEDFTVRLTGWDAAIFQHKFDYLDAITFIDRMSSEWKREVSPAVRNLILKFGEKYQYYEEPVADF